jgi:hypothetical protein
MAVRKRREMRSLEFIWFELIRGKILIQLKLPSILWK